MSERAPLTSLLPRAAALLVLGATLGFASNNLRRDGVPLAEFAPPVLCTDEDAPSELREVEILAPTAAAHACAEAPALIIDARSAEAFAEGHIAGALHLPCSASDEAAEVAESGISTGGLLLVYADSTDAALPVARQMQKRIAKPRQRIGVLEGGFAAWRDANFACASGGCPHCGEETSP
jgi:rhodanese-related sulfurtransferase